MAGAASRDVTSEDPRGWRLGGAVMYTSLALVRLGLGVRTVVGVDADAAGAAELDALEAEGAVLARAQLASGPVFENIETPTGRRQRCIATADPLPLTSLPRAWTSGFDAVVLAPVAGELPGDWAALAGGDPDAIVALGWQGLLRALEAGADVRRVPPRRDDLVAAATLIGSSRDDFPAGTAVESVAALVSSGATLVVTEGEAGGRVLRRGADGVTESRYPAIPSDGAIDATGAGDVFLAAMLAARLDRSLGEATTLAAAAASLAVEGPGLAGVPDLAAVRRRMTRAPSRDSR